VLFPDRRQGTIMSASGTALSTATTPPALATAADTLRSLLPEWATFPGVQYVAALLVLVTGVYLSRYVVRLLGRPIARRFQRESLAQTVLRLVRLTTVGLSLLVALTIANIPLGDLVLSAAVFSAVLGIVLAPIVGSTVNGLFVLADQPYEIGDMVELEDGTRGFVDDMTIRYTKIFTLDNTFLVVPNSVIREQRVVNYSAEDERTRLSLSVEVTYESDVARAREIMERGAAAVDIVIEGGPDIRVGSARYSARPTAYIDQYAADGVKLTMRYWTTKPYKLLKLRSAVLENVWTALEEAPDVEVAYPHRHLVFDDTSGVARVATAAANGESTPSEADGGGRTHGDGRAVADAEARERVPGPDVPDGGSGPGSSAEPRPSRDRGSDPDPDGDPWHDPDVETDGR
jgi:small-conductance mechanosensitive channel